MFTEGQGGHVVSGEEVLRSDEDVRQIAEVRLHVLLVVTGDEKSTVQVFPSVVVHRPAEIFHAGVDLEEGQEIATTNVNAHPSDRGQMAGRIDQLRFQVRVRNVLLRVIAQIQRDVPNS